MSEVHRLLLSLKNSFAPINRIPPEVLSLIPDYLGNDTLDRGLIKLTQVCRRWRNAFTSRSSLWAKLDFTNVDKTRTYIQRSQLSPLKLRLIKDQHTSYLDDAFSLVIPHIHRLESLTVQGDVLPVALGHFRCPAPLLKELYINLSRHPTTVLDSALFGGDLTSLRELTLRGNIANLPWKNLANLRKFGFLAHPIAPDVTQHLDFFESAPLLRTVALVNSLPRTSDAPPKRIVPLRHLNAFSIFTRGSPPSILLNHLHIPTGASLNLQFNFSGEESPLLDYLPEKYPNLRNLTHITAVNLRLHPREKYMRLSGSNGGLRLLACWGPQETDSYTMDCRILHSLGLSILSATQKLTISGYDHLEQNDPERCPVFQALSSTTNLRTLTLTECNNLPFVLALDPEENPSESILCPKLEELVLYIRTLEQFHTDHLTSMACNRARRGARLSSVAIFSLGELVPGIELLGLREHVGRVEHRVEDRPPRWDYVPGENGGEGN